jgi:hypothetical protein
MRSILRFLQAPSASIASGLLLASVPLAALAAEQAVRMFEPGTVRFWVTLGAVQMLWLVGYGASSLPAWAKWPDGTMQDRLTIVSGVITSGIAGNIGYYGGYYLVGLAEISCFISTGLAGWGGDKFLTPLLGRVVTAFDAILGKGAAGGEGGGNGGTKP